MNNFEKGLLFEKRAIQILQSKNFDIVGSRIKSKFGEIDILAKFKNDFYITEIKFRKSLDDAAHSISATQFQRSIITFFDFTQKHQLTFERYFYIAILFSNTKYKIIHCDCFQENFYSNLSKSSL